MLFSKIPHIHVNSLLALFRKVDSLETLHECPLDSRSLLNTMRCKVSVEQMGDGQYCHLGLRNGMERKLNSLNEIDLHVIESVDITIFVDGCSISRSSKSQLWPIVGVRAVLATPLLPDLFFYLSLSSTCPHHENKICSTKIPA